MWRIRRDGRVAQWNRPLAVALGALVLVSGLALSFSGSLPGAVAHGSHMGPPLPHTNITAAAFADTLAFPLRVDTQAALVGWSWDVIADLRGVEDPGFLVALVAQDRVVHTNTFFFGTPESSIEVRNGDTFFQLAPGDRNTYQITLRAVVAQSLPPGDHWLLLTVPDSFSLAAAVTVSYDIGTMTFETGVVDDNDAKGFHPSDFQTGTALDSGDLLTEKSVAISAQRSLAPRERMVYFAFLQPGLGTWEYQDDFNGQLRSAQGGPSGTASEVPTPTFTAITTSPATVTLQTAVGVQSFEHPFRFITVDLDF